MRAGAGQARAAGVRLFLTYALGSLVPLVVVGGLLVQDSRADAVRDALEQGRAQAAVVEEMAIAPALRNVDTAQGLTLPVRQRLQAATELSVFSGSVVRLRLRSFDGAVLFSDDGTVVDGVRSSSRAFRDAARGGMSSAALVRDPVDGEGQVVRALQPVVVSPTGRATGVLELYLPYDELARRADQQLARTTLRLCAALTVLYLFLGAISWGTSRSLRRQAQLREHQALHDGLTGLPNREAFLHAVAQELGAGADGGTTVVLVDLDRFKAVNDRLGHAAGDELLRSAAARLGAAVRAGDLAARLGGDEFALLLRGTSGPDDLRALLERLRADLVAPLLLDGTTVDVGASVGAATSPGDGRNADALLRAADAAMYAAKRSGGGVALCDDRAAPLTAPHTARTPTTTSPTTSPTTTAGAADVAVPSPRNGASCP